MSSADVKRAELTAFLAPRLGPNEQVVTGIGLASGPLHPLTPLIPIYGWIAMLTPRYGAWGLVVTSERVILVRRSRFQPGRPRKVELEAPLATVTVTGWSEGTSSGLLRLRIGDRAVKLYVVGVYNVDVHAVQAALAHRGPPAPGTVRSDTPPGDAPPPA